MRPFESARRVKDKNNNDTNLLQNTIKFVSLLAILTIISSL